MPARPIPHADGLPSLPVKPSSPTASPSRKVVSEFKPFSAPASMSMAAFNTGGPSGPASFQPRETTEDTSAAVDDDESMIQSVAMHFQAISFDQGKADPRWHVRPCPFSDGRRRAQPCVLL
jgi:hypothetical protein